ncbi:FtsW/RodA/SpoVE family cell cycle protein [Paenisporosarcina cavernae]|uniref:FtsW/RodA/SpoVE family cell cycle protein n=1 Tax=Paenisporosarcina cavernae TaxID=2320858 RepID=UPI001EE52F19|nr:putative peptidoglycan glycosyltransferase FtsW [Paenisporosarcina cavernae]
MVAGLLTAVGLAFVYSAGLYWGSIHYEGSMPFVWKQMIYVGIGVTSCYAISSIKTPFSLTFWFWLYLFSLVGLLGVFIPGIGTTRNGSSSWISLAGFTIQPSEFVKIALLGFMSSVLAQTKKLEKHHIWLLGVIALLPLALIILQPDFGSAMIIVCGIVFLLFIVGLPWKFFLLTGSLCLVGIVGLILAAPYRLKRLTAYLDPWQDPLGTGFQSIQSLLAFGPSGLFGYGYGDSRQKYLYLPEPQNDFIFAIFSEEMGLIGSVVLIGLFFAFLVQCFVIANEQQSVANSYFIISLTAMMGIQIFLNLAVVVGLVPVTGVTLPFISYGGSSMIATWVTIGFILQTMNHTTKGA